MEITLMVALIGCAVTVASYFVGRQATSKNEGKEAGSVSTDLKYIKESVNRIESRLDADVEKLDTGMKASVQRIEDQHDADVNRLDGRIDEISNQLAGANTTAARALEAAKSAHKRQDEHLERDHGKTVIHNDQ